MKKRPCSIGGFTLIELLVVVVIIGILVAIMIPNYHLYMIRGYNATAESDLGNFKIMMEAIYADKYAYPNL